MPGIIAIVGAGPYGLSIASHMHEAGLKIRIFGRPMQTWRHAVPEGMRMKSEGFATSLSDPTGKHTLASFCRAGNIPYQDLDLPVKVEVFAAHGIAFQQACVPQLEAIDVVRVSRQKQGFQVELESGEIFQAAAVIVATGIRSYWQIPTALADVSPCQISHSSQHSSLAEFVGKRVTVFGAGASALDFAAGLHLAGATVTVVARRRELKFFPPKGARTWLDALRAPMTPLGPGWRKWLCVNAPLLFTMLPETVRIKIFHRYLGASPTWHVRDLVIGHVDFVMNAEVERVAAVGDRLEIRVCQGSNLQRTITADHIIAATGYRLDVNRQYFLDAHIRAELDCVDHVPRVSRQFQSSVPGLYFVGTIASYRFGPLLRFVCGTGYAARRLTRHFLASEGARRASWFRLRRASLPRPQPTA